MRWLPLVALAACYSPSYRDCEITCTTSCPSGFHCESGVCRQDGVNGPCGPGDGGPDGPANDVDNDGVLNMDDNCPNDANTNQANEDGDPFGDVCDPCPPFANPSDNNDGDTDGVGDACDPDPTITGNRIVVFQGFKDTTAPSGATVLPATAWTFNGADAVVTVAGGVRASMTWPVQMPGMETVLVRFTPTVINAGTIGMGAVSRFDVSNSNAITCWLSTPVGGGPLLALLNVDGTVIMSLSQSMQINMPYRIDETRRGNAFSCGVDVNTNRVTGTATTVPNMPHSGFRTLGVSGRVHWVLIVSGP